MRLEYANNGTLSVWKNFRCIINGKDKFISLITVICQILYKNCVKHVLERILLWSSSRYHNIVDV